MPKFKYRVVRDSVGGDSCLIFYQDVKPVLTLWDFETKVNFSRTNLDAIDTESIDSLITTIKGLGGDMKQIRDAITTYLKELPDGDTGQHGGDA